MEEDDFCFTVRDEANRDRHFLVTVAPHDDRAKRFFVSIWHKMQQAAGKYHEFSGDAPGPG